MRTLWIVIIGLSILASGCALSNKRLRDSKKGAEGTTLSRTLAPATPIQVREVEEKLVPVENKTPEPYHYFVIIGSFRNRDNAGKYQDQLASEGFKSEILRNEAGLYRISVMATDDMDEARTEIGRIRTNFPKYSDTWLLIQKF